MNVTFQRYSFIPMIGKNKKKLGRKSGVLVQSVGHRPLLSIYLSIDARDLRLYLNEGVNVHQITGKINVNEFCQLQSNCHIIHLQILVRIFFIY